MEQKTGKKKIAFLVNSLGKGGAERVAVNLAEHFWKSGYDVLLVTSRRHPEEYEVTFPAKRRLLEEEIAGAPLGRAGKIPARVSGLQRIWKQERPDLVVALIGLAVTRWCNHVFLKNHPSYKKKPVRATVKRRWPWQR